MRIFAVSDIHVDYEVNALWVAGLSTQDYRDDVLILAGDITEDLRLLDWCVTALARCFRTVLFVPGNHDIWVRRDSRFKTSIEKFAEVRRVVEHSGGSMSAFHGQDVSVVPLFGWYDYSFGEPCAELCRIWMDFHACRWPDGLQPPEIAELFDSLNVEGPSRAGVRVISFSHFMPRIDLMPETAPPSTKMLYPILGTTKLERRIRSLGSDIHVYGHSHLNRYRKIDGVTYINNAFAYPRETRIAAKRLLCVHGA